MIDINQLSNFLNGFVQTLAIIIAAIAIIIDRKRAKRTRDLDIMLNLSESFRERWENSWEKQLKEIEKSKAKKLSLKNKEELCHMLNWIDWLGTIINTKVLTNDKIIFGSIGITIKRMIDAGRQIIEEDTKKHGNSYWKSLFIVAERLNIEWIQKQYLNEDKK